MVSFFMAKLMFLLMQYEILTFLSYLGHHNTLKMYKIIVYTILSKLSLKGFFVTHFHLFYSRIHFFKAYRS